MKKIQICLLLLAGVFFSSCDDALDIAQPGQTDPSETYTSMSGLRKNLVGVYGSLTYESTIAFSSIFTDEVGIGFANGGQGLTDGSYSYVLNSGSDSPLSIWSTYYGCINNCNRLIEGSLQVPTADEDEVAELNHIVAQAKGIRAFAYFQLLSYFSTDLTDDSALGVMLFDNVPGLDSPAIPRSTNGEVFAFIQNDLLFVDANLDEDFYSADANVVFFINENFVTAFRARMAAFREDYVNAQIYAQQLIDGGSEGTLVLTPAATYPTIWTDAINGESIFKLSRSTNDATIGSIWASVSSTASGSPFFEMGRSLYNLYPSNDVRRTTFVSASAVIDPDYQNSADYRSTDILPIAKYPRSESTNLLGDVKVFRLSEMYFIKAEAQIASGDLAGAAATIRTVRLRRTTVAPAPALPSYANEQEGWTDVLDERRKELCYEGHRYLDLKRLAVKANVTINRDPKDCEFNNSCDFSNTDHRFTLPIPTAELIANQPIRSQQNPGY